MARLIGDPHGVMHHDGIVACRWHDDKSPVHHTLFFSWSRSGLSMDDGRSGGWVRHGPPMGTPML